MAEVLLQKTRAPAVAPVYEQLILVAPTAAALNALSDEAVLKIVAGLGLPNQRLRKLRQAARVVMAGVDDVCVLGQYLAGAVAVSLERPAAPVDGNISRVISRYAGITVVRGELRKNARVREIVGQLFGRAIAHGQGRHILYALLDLGNIVCTRVHPSCLACPLARGCATTSKFSPVGR